VTPAQIDRLLAEVPGPPGACARGQVDFYAAVALEATDARRTLRR
jgi:hypothetical protein